ncbi:MAG: MotA/TolQ/ExbB proton channel family protein, partial [Phycisphaerales bacterium]|nr:MotA/TolQ/ExbB proton channel family protein [Phycisphaerales bacterium]
LQQGKYRAAIDQVARDESFFGRIVHAGLAQANQGHGAILRALEQTAEELVAIRMRRIELLNVLGQVSPMIGLFGTVYGMILAFQAIVVAGGSADPVRLAGGISTALTTTFWGLVVAIPALAAFALLRTRIDELTSEATLRAEAMFNPFRSKPTPPKSADAPRPTTGG